MSDTTTTMPEPTLTGRERTFDPDELIVTKTDTGGRITYANDVFLRISGLTEAEALGRPHSLIRHPHMPRCVFRLLWQEIQAGREIFAFVLNRAANGDHYWVFAHVTPTVDATGGIVSYHSNRRVPDKGAIAEVIAPLYADLLRIEASETSKQRGMDAATAHLTGILEKKGLDYERFVFSLAR
jgi:PAS domain S-box-containing protein